MRKSWFYIKALIAGMFVGIGLHIGESTMSKDTLLLFIAFLESWKKDDFGSLGHSK